VTPDSHFNRPAWSPNSLHKRQVCPRDTFVEALHVLDWRGWEDLETFLNHYKGSYSPEAKKRVHNKVEWL